MARPLALAMAIVAALLAVSGAGGAATQQKPKRGGTVVVAWEGTEPPCLAVWLQACRAGDYSELLGSTLESAFEPGPHTWRPALVSRPTITTHPFTVTYRVRARARWSDGRPILASDFLFGFRVLLKYAGLDSDDPARTIQRVEAVDSRTVRVVFRRRESAWRPAVNLIPLPRHVLRGLDLTKVWRDGVDNPLTGAPIGDGPFLIQRWDRGRQLVLARNPHYGGSHTAYLDRVVFLLDLSDVAKALRDGAADVTGGGSGGPQAAQEFVDHPTPGIRVLSTPGFAWEHFDVNMKSGHPALEDKRVRQALAYGIDRDTLVRRQFARIAPSVRQLDSTSFLTNEPAYEPNWRTYRSRPEKARTLLRQAGCRAGVDGVYVCAGQRLSLRFVTTSGNPRRDETLRIVQAQLRRIGIEVLRTYAPLDAFFGEILPRGDFDVALFAWHKVLPVDITTITYACGNDANFTGYCSRLVTDDLGQLERIVEPVRYADVANRVDRRFAQDVPMIPLYQPPLFIAFTDSLQGVVPNAFNAVTWNAENWWLDR